MATATADEKRTSENDQEETSQGTAHRGLTTAAVAVGAAVATGAATYGAKKLMSHDGGGNGNGASGAVDRVKSAAKSSGSGSGSLLSAVASGSWDAARDALIPIAEDAAEALGKYTAKNAPDFLRDRIVPRFVSAFQSAGGGD